MRSWLLRFTGALVTGFTMAAMALPAQAVGRQEGVVELDASEHTMGVVTEHESWAVVALRCTEATVAERGTRSQRLRFTARVIEAMGAELPAIWSGDQYGFDQALLRANESFVVVAVLVHESDGVTWWKIIQADSLGARDPVTAVEALEAAITRSLSVPGER